MGFTDRISTPIATGIRALFVAGALGWAALSDRMKRCSVLFSSKFSAPIAGVQTFRSLRNRLALILGLGVLSLGLTGCVDYQLGIQLDSPNQGRLIQTIRLDNDKNPTAQALLAQIRQQARSVQGSVKARSPQELEVTVPFHTAKELERQFNQFFQGQTNPDLPTIVSHLKIQQRNWLLFEEDRLTFDLDLKSLALQGTEALSLSSDLFHLGLAVNDQSWDLKPGETQTINTVVWMPMPLGWGALAIVAIVLVGQKLRPQV